MICPHCQSAETRHLDHGSLHEGAGRHTRKCRACGYEWTAPQGRPTGYTGDYHLWTAEEDALLRTYYPQGAALAAAHLPGHSLASCKQRWHRLTHPRPPVPRPERRFVRTCPQCHSTDLERQRRGFPALGLDRCGNAIKRVVMHCRACGCEWLSRRGRPSAHPVTLAADGAVCEYDVTDIATDAEAAEPPCDDPLGPRTRVLRCPDCGVPLLLRELGDHECDALDRWCHAHPEPAMEGGCP